MVEDSREMHACFGKWFTEKNFVNRFRILPADFPVKTKYFPLTFSFTAYQMSENTENDFRKTFYFDSNRA